MLGGYPSSSLRPACFDADDAWTVTSHETWLNLVSTDPIEIFVRRLWPSFRISPTAMIQGVIG